MGNNPFNRNDPLGLSAAQAKMLSGGLGGQIASSYGVRAAATQGIGIAGLSVVLPLTLSGDTPNQNNSYKYITYTRTNPLTNQVYSGRSSGYGTAEEIAIKRGYGQPLLNAEGFSSPQVDQSSTNYGAIRGREQQLIDVHGGAQSQGGSSRNKINGVSDINPLKPIYIFEANKEFGTLP